MVLKHANFKTMKKLYCNFIVIAFILFISPKSVSASHLMGSDLTWTCIAQDQFLVKLVVYRDCNGILLSTAPINFKCATSGQTIKTLSIGVGTPVDITPINNGSCTRCQDLSCSFPFGIQRYTMEAIVKLNGAGSCCIIELTWHQCCRNYAITTMIEPGQTELYIEAQLNRCLNPCDNSPVFSNMPVAILCNGQDFTYSHGVYDADTIAGGGLSDSLVFSWTTPLTNDGLPLLYTGQYNYNKPIYFLGFPDTGLALPSGFHLNTETGDISFRPMENEVTVMVLNVKEYRKGQLIGIIRRDMQIMVISCDIIAPLISPNSSPKKNTVKLGESITLNFSVLSNSEDSTFISWNKSIPNAIWTDDNGTTRTPTGTLYWKPEANQLSSLPYIFTVMVRKNSAPMNSQYSESYQIYIKKAGSSGISAETESNEICVYPNPASDACLVVLKNKKIRIKTAKVFDTEGRSVRNYSDVNSSELRVERAELSKGNYIIRVNTSDGKTFVEKLSFN
jgi:hypothetical protein